MKRSFLILILIVFVSNFLFSDPQGTDATLYNILRNDADSIKKIEMSGIAEFFGGDLFEGRAPGTRGGRLAENYIKSTLKFLGIEPFNGKYIHEFKLTGFTSEKLTLSANGIVLKKGVDIVGSYIGKENNFDLKGDAVFIGFGTKTDLWNWDDFKGTDIKGKIAIVRVNDPGMYKKEIFEGNTLTYFGRWTYHIEEAKKRGALGVLLIHTDKSAGYGWDVVRNSWSGEELYLDSFLKDNLKFTGWIRESAIRKILKNRGIDLNELYKKSIKRSFKPVDLAFGFEISGMKKTRIVKNANVAGIIRGKSEKKIVLTAHIDHFGIDNKRSGDQIFNGAIDNGTAVTSMLLAAKILNRHKDKLRYSVVILATNAEESGLLGSTYFIQNYKNRDIIANINFESTPVWKKSDTIMGVGARFSTIEDMLREIAKKEGLKYSYFTMSNQGFFFRSDQFPFARAKIPGIWISCGERDASGGNDYAKFWKERYHTVKDEFNENWPLEGLKETVKYSLLLIGYMSDRGIKPIWKKNLTFPFYKK